MWTVFCGRGPMWTVFWGRDQLWFLFPGSKKASSDQILKHENKVANKHCSDSYRNKNIVVIFFFTSEFTWLRMSILIKYLVKFDQGQLDQIPVTLQLLLTSMHYSNSLWTCCLWNTYKLIWDIPNQHWLFHALSPLILLVLYSWMLMLLLLC